MLLNVFDINTLKNNIYVNYKSKYNSEDLLTSQKISALYLG